PLSSHPTPPHPSRVCTASPPSASRRRTHLGSAGHPHRRRARAQRARRERGPGAGRLILGRLPPPPSPEDKEHGSHHHRDPRDGRAGSDPGDHLLRPAPRRGVPAAAAACVPDRPLDLEAVAHRGGADAVMLPVASLALSTKSLYSVVYPSLLCSHDRMPHPVRLVRNSYRVGSIDGSATSSKH
ncbi:unnamed protein product, partial [Urochloa humidicola]